MKMPRTEKANKQNKTEEVVSVFLKIQRKNFKVTD